MRLGLPGAVTRRPGSFRLFLGVGVGYCSEGQPGEAGEGRDVRGKQAGDDSQAQKGCGLRSADLTVPGVASSPKCWHVQLSVLGMPQCLCTCSLSAWKCPLFTPPPHLSSFSGLSSAYKSFCYFIDVESIFSVVLISAVQPRDSVIHVCILFSDSFPLWFVAGYRWVSLT